MVQTVVGEEMSSYKDKEKKHIYRYIPTRTTRPSGILFSPTMGVNTKVASGRYTQDFDSQLSVLSSLLLLLLLL